MEVETVADVELEPFDIPGARSKLAALRREAAALLALIDTSELPRPRQIREPGEQLPGPEWRVGKDWTVHVVDGEHDMVYVHTPADVPVLDDRRRGRRPSKRVTRLAIHHNGRGVTDLGDDSGF